MVGNRGTTIGYRLPVRLNGAPFNIRQAGISIVATVKRSRSDAAPLLTKTWRFDHPPPNDPGMSDPDTNTLQFELLPGDTDDFTKTEFLVADFILTEPDGRETPIAQGAVTVRRGVGT